MRLVVIEGGKKDRRDLRALRAQRRLARLLRDASDTHRAEYLTAIMTAPTIFGGGCA